MDRVEKVARAMAIADERDPDQPIGRWQFKRIVGRTISIFKHDPKLPCWTYYVPLAKVFIAAVNALDDEPA